MTTLTTPPTDDDRFPSAWADLADLLHHPAVQAMQRTTHHQIPQIDHIARVVAWSSRLEPVLGADMQICRRAALLHDLDAQTGTLLGHAATASRWAADQGEDPRVCAAIASHMFPLGPPPANREGWVLSIADKVATLADLRQVLQQMATAPAASGSRPWACSTLAASLVIALALTLPRLPEHSNALRILSPGS
jgi:glycyl-tRNA synthetase beta chain/uncharacterized protein